MPKKSQIIMRIDEKEKEKIKLLANSKGMNISEYLMWLVKCDMQVRENVLTVMESFKE